MYGEMTVSRVRSAKWLLVPQIPPELVAAYCSSAQWREMNRWEYSVRNLYACIVDN